MNPFDYIPAGSSTWIAIGTACVSFPFVCVLMFIVFLYESEETRRKGKNVTRHPTPGPAAKGLEGELPDDDCP